MKVEVTVCGKPFRSHPVGAKLYLRPMHAKTLVALKRVTYTNDDATVEVPPVAVLEEVAPKRTYRTRAIKAE